MSDEYICKVCGHRAGDHAVANRCIVDGCFCADDPYLEQLDALSKQIDEQGKVNDSLFSETVSFRKQVEEDRRCIELMCIGSTELCEQLKILDEANKLFTTAIAVWTERCFASEKKLDIAVDGIRYTKTLLEQREVHLAMRNDDAVIKLQQTLAEIEKVGG